MGHLPPHQDSKTRRIRKIMASQQRPPIQRIQIRNPGFCCKRPLQSPQTTREPNRRKSVCYSTMAANVCTLQIICDQSWDWSLCKRKNSILTHLASLSSKSRAAKWWVCDFKVRTQWPDHDIRLDVSCYLPAFTREGLHELCTLGWSGNGRWAVQLRELNWFTDRFWLLLELCDRWNESRQRRSNGCESPNVAQSVETLTEVTTRTPIWSSTTKTPWFNWVTTTF